MARLPGMETEGVICPQVRFFRVNSGGFLLTCSACPNHK